MNADYNEIAKATVARKIVLVRSEAVFTKRIQHEQDT